MSAALRAEAAAMDAERATRARLEQQVQVVAAMRRQLCLYAQTHRDCGEHQIAQLFQDEAVNMANFAGALDVLVFERGGPVAL